MTQPTAYTRQFNFTGFSASNPSDQQPGVYLDAELNAAKRTFDGILASLKLIQRDDGALANGSVGLNQVANDVLLTLSGKWTPRGAWASATVYAVSDVVLSSGSSYVCAKAHTSGVFATDVAANDWIIIFGPTVATVPDNAVSTIKLQDGSVTPAKLSFTSLDLTGTLRGQGGVAAGSATAGGYLISGALTAGDVYANLARGTTAQGQVGIRLDGGTAGSVWQIRQATGSNSLDFRATSIGAVNNLSISPTGLADFGFSVRASGSDTPAAGAGVELYYAAGVGHISAYDRTGVVAKPLKLEGLTVLLAASGVTVGTISSTKADFIGLSINGVNVGFLGAPLNTQSANYTLVLTDAGKRIYSANSGATTITIPLNASVAFPVDDGIIQIVNNGTTAIAISPTGGVTLIQDGTGTTGALSVPPASTATLQKVGTDTWFLSQSLTPAFFESGEMSATAGTVNTTVAHGLGVTPKRVSGVLRCKTADIGYSVGEEVDVLFDNASGARGVVIRNIGDATNLGYVVGTGSLSAANGSTGAGTSMTNSSWRVVLRAWAK